MLCINSSQIPSSGLTDLKLENSVFTVSEQMIRLSSHSQVKTVLSNNRADAFHVRFRKKPETLTLTILYNKVGKSYNAVTAVAQWLAFSPPNLEVTFSIPALDVF